MPRVLAENAHRADRPVTGRLAPSPTGLLHLGHARSFLIAWWQARASGGRVVMRIDDLDGDRATQHFADRALTDLEWLGLDWDGTPRRQSDHVDAMTDAARRLYDQGLAFGCVCSRGDIRRAVSAPHASETELRYPGTCRNRFVSWNAARDADRAVGIRLRVAPGPVTFDDRLRGRQNFDVGATVGDFLILRRTSAPAYQLSVVVDDAAQGVTDVVRGDDLLPSTARQLLLQRALDLQPPRWWHVPLVVDARGRRLAKRDDALSLSALRDRNVPPAAIVAWAARSSGFDVPRRVEARDVLSVFDPARLATDPVIVTDETIDALGR